MQPETTVIPDRSQTEPSQASGTTCVPGMQAARHVSVGSVHGVLSRSAAQQSARPLPSLHSIHGDVEIHPSTESFPDLSQTEPSQASGTPCVPGTQAARQVNVGSLQGVLSRFAAQQSVREQRLTLGSGAIWNSATGARARARAGRRRFSARPTCHSPRAGGAHESSCVWILYRAWQQTRCVGTGVLRVSALGGRRRPDVRRSVFLEPADPFRESGRV